MWGNKHKPHKRARGSLVGLVAAVVAFAVSASASAATITVNTGGDGLPDAATECNGAAGDCSLRQALDKAHTSGDAIEIPATVPTITLVHGALTVAKNVTIAGAGAAKTKIDGNLASGLFSLHPGEAVTISGLTLTRGDYQFGAAIAIQGGRVTLNGDSFTANVSGGSNTDGFGVIDETGPSTAAITITGCSFSENHVGGGGTSGSGFGVVDFDPLSNDASLTLAETSFSGNTIGGDGATGFGTLDYDTGGTNSRLVISGSTFSGNHVGTGGGASGFGGGVVAEVTNGGTVSIANSRFTGNVAGGDGTTVGASGSGFGGGLDVSFSSGGTFTLQNSTISANRLGGTGSSGSASGAGRGGGLALNLGPNVTATMGEDTFSSQRVGGNGGVGANSGAAFGGAIDVAGGGSTDHVTLLNSTINGNAGGGTPGSGTGAGAGLGGGIYIEAGPMTLVNDTIDGNSLGSRGSGAGLRGEGPVDSAITLENTILADNTVAGAAGNCGSVMTSHGHNLIDHNPGGCGLTASGDLTGDPHVAPLGDNGGTTLTQALLGGPAIDAGTNTGCPSTDQRGVERPQGPLCDIGAYELAPPQAMTGAASNVKTTSAILHGTAANPDALAGSADFQFGTTKAYSKRVRTALAPGTPTSALSLTVSKLRPHTLYHYRIVATNPDGTEEGAGLTFKTPAVPPRLSHLKIKPSRFTAKHGARVFYRDSAGGTTTFTVLRQRANGSYRKIGALKHTGRAGANHFHFTGRLGAHKLKPGRYRLQAVARSLGQKSKPVRTGFKIIAR